MRKFVLTDSLFGFLLAMPALAVLGGIIAFPLIYALYLSFFPLHLTRPDLPRCFVGLSSYVEILINPLFINAMINTFFFVGVTLSVEFLLALTIALLLNQEIIKGKGVFRTLFILPLMIAPVVAGLQWRWIFSDQYGILNYILKWIHLPTPLWLGDPWAAMYAVIIANLWVATPFVMMVLLAGLQSLPEEPLEAARIEGASSFQALWHITLPLLKPAILVAFLIRLTDAFRIFDIVYILTRGGPGGSTEVASTFILKHSFEYLNFSEGASGSFILVLVMAVISLFLIKAFR